MAAVLQSGLLIISVIRLSPDSRCESLKSLVRYAGGLQQGGVGRTRRDSEAAQQIRNRRGIQCSQKDVLLVSVFHFRSRWIFGDWQDALPSCLSGTNASLGDAWWALRTSWAFSLQRSVTATLSAPVTVSAAGAVDRV